MKGLILAGGDGSRLGAEKAFIKIRDKNQVSFLTSEFENMQMECFVSIPDKKKNLFPEYNLIIDSPKLKGPLAGITAAFDFDAGPWMIFAVDMPLVNREVMDFLLKNRKGGIATCLSKDLKKPEPLAAIWEQEANQPLRNFISNSGDSASQFLIENKANLIKPKSEEWISNINYPEDLEVARTKLSNSETD